MIIVHLHFYPWAYQLSGPRWQPTWVSTRPIAEYDRFPSQNFPKSNGYFIK